MHACKWLDTCLCGVLRHVCGEVRKGQKKEDQSILIDIKTFLISSHT